MKKTREDLYYYCSKSCGLTINWIRERTSDAREILMRNISRYQKDTIMGAEMRTMSMIGKLEAILVSQAAEEATRDDIICILDWILIDIAEELTEELCYNLQDTVVFYRLCKDDYTAALGLCPSYIKDHIELTIMDLGANELINRIKSGFYN